MFRSNLTFASLALCWILSPDALVLLGNSIGIGGLFFLAQFTIGAVLSLLIIVLTCHPQAKGTTDNSFSCLANATGLVPAMTLTLAARLGLVLFLPTGMLVTAGFSFNETFLFWFPNFAFSFLLLTIILALHLAGRQIALAAQPLFIGLTIGCLGLLCLAGLFGSPGAQPLQVETGETFTLSVSPVCTALLLFLGYETLHSSDSPGSRRYYLFVFIAGFILLALWAIVSLQHVPPAKLAKSTIPNVISARAILGQPGRIIMGLAVISGTCGLVNGLFLLAGRSLEQIADSIFPSSAKGSAWRQRSWPVLFSLAIGIFMAAGLAGSEKLETYIYSALLCWLLLTGLRCFAAARMLQTNREISSAPWYLFSAVFPLAAVWLTYVSQQSTTLAVCCLLLLGGSAALSAGLVRYHRIIQNKKPPQTQGDTP